MAKSIDAGSKDLLNYDPLAWLRLTKAVPEGAEVSVVETDLSTITASSDKIFEISEGSNLRHIIIEFQAQKDLQLIANCHLRELALRRKLLTPVVDTFIFYAHPSTVPEETSLEQHRLKHAHSPDSQYHYRAIKLWELNPDDLIQGGPAVAPLATLAQFPKSELARIVDRIEQVVKTIDSEEIRNQIWSATFFLAGIKYRDVGFLNEIFSGRLHMESSVTYQYVLEKGKKLGLDEGKKLGLDEGKKLGLDEGKKLGLDEGIHLGAIRIARQTLIDLCHERFPDTPQQLDELILSCEEESLLNQAIRKILSARSWSDVEAILKKA